MTASIRRVIREPLKLQRLRRNYRQQQGTFRETYLAVVSGSIRGTKPGYLWVHDAASADANGNVTYGAPYQLRIKPGAFIDLRPNWKVNVVTIKGIEYIESMNFEEMERAGYNPLQTNLGDPSRQALLLENIVNLQSKPKNNNNVQVAPGLYEKANGTFGIFSGESALDILTAYTPVTADYSLIACVWLDTYTNELSVTVSSEFAQSATIRYTPTEALPYMNEAAANRTSDAIGIKCYLVNDDTTTMDITTMFHDLRPFLHSNDDIGWSHVLYRNRRIWGNHQQLVHGQQTINSGKQLTIEDGGQLVVL